jgi:hypothetical protein
VIVVTVSIVLAALGSTGGCVVLWSIFFALLAFAWWANPPTWLKPLLAFWLSVILATAIVVTTTASGVKIDDVVVVLNQLGIKSPE